jgi:hypothetical protein
MAEPSSSAGASPRGPSVVAEDLDTAELEAGVDALAERITGSTKKKEPDSAEVLEAARAFQKIVVEGVKESEPVADGVKDPGSETMPEPPITSPFTRALPTEKRLKLFLWGDSGSGKTQLALQFPHPVVIDLERGTDLYSGRFHFDRTVTTDADAVMAAVDWLRENRHSYRTLVIDPITVYYEALQSKWSDIFLRRNKGSKGFKHEFYDMQPRDWMTIRSEFYELVRKITELDMNVVVTAHMKAQYADSGFMQKIGDTWDSQKKTPYLFDAIVQLVRREGRFTSRVEKDRTGRLPPTEEFPTEYRLFAKAFGEESLDREAQPFQSATKEQIGAILELSGALGLTKAKIASRIQSYGANSLEDLSRTNAAVIVSKLQAAVTKNPEKVAEAELKDLEPGKKKTTKKKGA